MNKIVIALLALFCTPAFADELPAPIPRTGTSLRVLKDANAAAGEIVVLVDDKTGYVIGRSRADIENCKRCEFPIYGRDLPLYLGPTEKLQHAEQKHVKEAAKAEKRATKAIDWSHEHRDLPMPVADVKLDEQKHNYPNNHPVN